MDDDARRDLTRQLEDVADAARSSGFSGVIRVDLDGSVAHRSAHGFADRAHGVASTPDTRIGIASGAKGFTALTVMSLAESGELPLDTTARSLLGDDLPLIDPAVTVEHLLCHRSGIGDYLDESVHADVNDYVMPLPVHRLGSPEEYLAVLDGFPMVSIPGEQFEYNNGGYVVLAVLIERATGRSYYDLVEERVCAPAGLAATGFLRSDELPGDVAIGYLHADGLRSNLLHLPVRGAGDGGIHTCAADLEALWRALFAGRIVRPDTLATMVRPHGVSAAGNAYGLGFWLSTTTDAVELEGYDAGASFRTRHQRSLGITWSVLSNTSNGAWPVVERVEAVLGGIGATSAITANGGNGGNGGNGATGS